MSNIGNSKERATWFDLVSTFCSHFFCLSLTTQPNLLLVIQLQGTFIQMAALVEICSFSTPPMPQVEGWSSRRLTLLPCDFQIPLGGRRKKRRKRKTGWSFCQYITTHWPRYEVLKNPIPYQYYFLGISLPVFHSVKTSQFLWSVNQISSERTDHSTGLPQVRHSLRENAQSRIGTSFQQW